MHRIIQINLNESKMRMSLPHGLLCHSQDLNTASGCDPSEHLRNKCGFKIHVLTLFDYCVLSTKYSTMVATILCTKYAYSPVHILEYIALSDY